MTQLIRFRVLFLLSTLLLGLPTARAEDFIQTIGGVNTLLYGIAAGIAALMITLHAIRWKVAGGPHERDEAKRGIINVILGLMLIIVAATIVNLLYVKPTVVPGTGADCDQLDGWYTTKALGPTCLGNDLCTDTVERTQRDYSASGASCAFSVVKTQNECAVALKPCPAGQTCANGVCVAGGVPSCDMLDGWYTVKSLGPTCFGGKQCIDAVEKALRDYYISAGSCTYVETQRKNDCASGLRDCPPVAKCENGLCVGGGGSTTTLGATTTSAAATTTTTTTSTTTTIPPEKLLTAKNLVDCINSKKGELHSIEPVSGCAQCRLIKCKVFGKEVDPPVGPGRPEYDRLKIIDVGMGPIWVKADGGEMGGCRTMPVISDFYGCDLVPVPGHAYKKCEEDPGIIEFDC